MAEVLMVVDADEREEQALYMREQVDCGEGPV